MANIGGRNQESDLLARSLLGSFHAQSSNTQAEAEGVGDRLIEDI